MKAKSSHTENETEICNTCCQPVSRPYRYQVGNQVRGCIASCHDPYVAVNTKPAWMKPRMVKPAWVSEAQRQFKAKHGIAA
jgi:hypothetical protein